MITIPKHLNSSRNQCTWNNSLIMLLFCQKKRRGKSDSRNEFSILFQCMRQSSIFWITSCLWWWISNMRVRTTSQCILQAVFSFLVGISALSYIFLNYANLENVNCFYMYWARNIIKSNSKWCLSRSMKVQIHCEGHDSAIKCVFCLHSRLQPRKVQGSTQTPFLLSSLLKGCPNRSLQEREWRFAFVRFFCRGEAFLRKGPFKFFTDAYNILITWVRPVAAS